MRLQSLRPIWETKVVKGLTQEDFQNINRKAIQQSKEEVDATNLMEANQEVSKQMYGFILFTFVT